MIAYFAEVRQPEVLALPTANQDRIAALRRLRSDLLQTRTQYTNRLENCGEEVRKHIERLLAGVNGEIAELDAKHREAIKTTPENKARVMRVRGGRAETLLHPDVLGKIPEQRAAVATTPELAQHDWIPVSSFQHGMPTASSGPLHVELFPGDRLLFIVGQEFLQALEQEPGREALLVVDPGRAVEAPTREMIDGGHGIVAVDIS